MFFFLEQENNLSNRPYQTTEALEEHSEKAVSSVLYLILECIGKWTSAPFSGLS